MNFLHTLKKLNKVYVWLAVDRNRNKIIDVKVTESRGFSSYLPIAMSIENNYNINMLCTDGYPAYAKFQIAEKHIITKAETSLAESKNALIRHYLARFNRRTIRYSKAIDMIETSLLLLFSSRNELSSIVL